MKRIDAINSKESFQREVAELHRVGVRVLFRFGSAQDFKQSTQIIGELGQGGLELQDCDYYTKSDNYS
jgi:predicted metalloendopeptidase